VTLVSLRLVGFSLAYPGPSPSKWLSYDCSDDCKHVLSVTSGISIPSSLWVQMILVWRIRLCQVDWGPASTSLHGKRKRGEDRKIFEWKSRIWKSSMERCGVFSLSNIFLLRQTIGWHRFTVTKAHLWTFRNQANKLTACRVYFECPRACRTLSHGDYSSHNALLLQTLRSVGRHGANLTKICHWKTGILKDKYNTPASILFISVRTVKPGLDF